MPLTDLIVASGGTVDRTPDYWAWTTCNNLEVNTFVCSNIVTPVGYGGATPVCSTCGCYRINGGSWVPGTTQCYICPGQTLQLGTTTSTCYTGGINSTSFLGPANKCILVMWQTCTRAQDFSPSNFCACCFAGVTRNTACCYSITLTGFDCTSVTSYGASIKTSAGGAWGTGPCCVCTGQTICLCVLASSLYTTASPYCVCFASDQLYYGCTVTAALDQTPDCVCVASFSNVTPNTCCCWLFIPTGFDCATVAKSGACMLINVNGAGWGNGPCCVCAGQIVYGRVCGPVDFGTSVSYCLCIGTVGYCSGTLTTCAEPAAPQIMCYCACRNSCCDIRYGIFNSPLGTHNTVTICGISAAPGSYAQIGPFKWDSYNCKWWLQYSCGGEYGSCLSVFCSTGPSGLSWALAGTGCGQYRIPVLGTSKPAMADPNVGDYPGSWVSFCAGTHPYYSTNAPAGAVSLRGCPGPFHYYLSTSLYEQRATYQYATAVCQTCNCEYNIMNAVYTNCCCKVHFIEHIHSTPTGYVGLAWFYSCCSMGSSLSSYTPTFTDAGSSYLGWMGFTGNFLCTNCTNCIWAQAVIICSPTGLPNSWSKIPLGVFACVCCDYYSCVNCVTPIPPPMSLGKTNENEWFLIGNSQVTNRVIAVCGTTALTCSMFTTCRIGTCPEYCWGDTNIIFLGTSLTSPSICIISGNRSCLTGNVCWYNPSTDYGGTSRNAGGYGVAPIPVFTCGPTWFPSVSGAIGRWSMQVNKTTTCDFILCDSTGSSRPPRIHWSNVDCKMYTTGNSTSILCTLSSPSPGFTVTSCLCAYCYPNDGCITINGGWILR